MKTYRVKTDESVEGTYTVTARNKDEVYVMLEGKQGIVDWSGITQDNYLAYSLEIKSIEEIE